MKTKNVSDLRNNILEVFDALRAGEIEPKAAVEMSNAAGKAISAAKVQLAYHALRGEVPVIPFLGEGVALEEKRGVLSSGGALIP
jgi:hypothetical protein